MFVAALVTIAKTWKQPKCISTAEQIKIWYINNGGLPWWLSGKESACNAGDLGSIPGSGISLGRGNGNPFQYSCLGNPMNRGAWWGTVHGVAKSQTPLRN